MTIASVIEGNAAKEQANNLKNYLKVVIQKEITMLKTIMIKLISCKISQINNKL